MNNTKQKIPSGTGFLLWSRWWESDPRPADYESAALPLSPTGILPIITNKNTNVNEDCMKLTDIGYIKQLMAQNGASFKKKFGQNFLTSESALEDIADNACENVLEIGPGIGSLTQKLCERADRVLALEIDSDLIPVLEQTLDGYDNVTVIEGDVMKLDLASLCAEHFPFGEISVCANLPYYITTPILVKLLGCGVKFKSITIMIQKEVAARLCAAPGSADYGSITAFISYYGTAKRLFTVPAGAFLPPPKVDSAVVRIDLYSEPPVNANPEMLFRVIEGAFAQRRKTLLNSLSSSLGDRTKEQIVSACERASVDPAVRGEKLGLEEFARLTDELYD